MGAGRTGGGVWMDAAAVVTQRHQERIARSLAAYAERGVTLRRRRSWGPWFGLFARRSTIIVTVNGDRIR
jgi:hypothetical protein